MDEVFAVPEEFDGTFAAFFEDLAAAGGELGVAHFAGHFLGRPQRRQIQRADHGVGAVEVNIVGVVLAPLDQAVAIAILANHELHRLADAGPEGFEEAAIGRHLVFAVGLQHGAGLAIAGPELPSLAAEHDGAGGFDEAGLGIVVLHDADRAFQFGEQPGHGMLVVPHVGAGAVAAADAFPGPEASVGPPLAGAGGQGGNCGEQAVQ